MWLIYSILSAVFAGAVAILAKLGMEGVDSDLATAIRCIVIVVVAWGVVLARGLAPQLPHLGLRNWVFMSLSGVATGLSWLFYFRALKIARVAQVAPVDKLSIAFAILLAFVVLGEVPTIKVAIGAALVIAGSLVIAL